MVARYRVEFGDRSVELPRGELLVGRDEACQIRFASGSVSRRHLRVLVVGATVTVYDLGSSNGTWVNDVRVEGPTAVREGDEIRVGDERFRLRRVPEDVDWQDAPATEPRGRILAYSTPRYRTCRGCLALIDAEASSCPRCSRETLPPPPLAAPPRTDDRRAARRLAIDAHALYVSPSLTFEGRLVDISSQGLFIATDLVDPVGTRADVVLFCASAGGARLGGEVVRVATGEDPSEVSGMAIELCDVESAARRWLEGYLVGHGRPGDPPGGCGRRG